MCMMNSRTYTCLSHNNNDSDKTKLNQYVSTGITLTDDLKFRMTERGSGGDPKKLGRWACVCIGGKDDIATVFVSAYRPCKKP